jgi:DNA-binding GntR family transcriptional regulator
VTSDRSNGLPDLSGYAAGPLVGRRGSTTDDVTAALREAILDGALAPGTWLREQDLAARLGVSRTPVREALRHLADEQIVDRSTNRGAVVRTMGLDEILALYVVRAALEGLAARMACTRRAEGLVDRLDGINASMCGAIDGPPGTLAILNLEFHRTIRESTGNPYLERFLRQVEHAVRRFGTTTYEDPTRARESLREHQEIVRAIAACDAARAENAAIMHMSRARDARIADVIDNLHVRL